MTLAARIAVQIDALQAEKARIQEQAKLNLAEVDAKLATLRNAKQAMTPQVEQAYLALVASGLLREIE